MKYKVGDQVKIKSLDWYNKNKNKDGIVGCGNANFIPDMVIYCGDILTIYDVNEDLSYYYMKGSRYAFRDEMIEGLVEPIDCKKCGLTRISTRCLLMDNCPHNQPKNTIEIPEGWVLKDEQGNIINATKIVLEKKKKKYPKTYEECCRILSFDEFLYSNTPINPWYRWKLFHVLNMLIVCRDAYWRLAGFELGLGKPWKPDWENDDHESYPAIVACGGKIIKSSIYTHDNPFTFPTEEMRDAFYENFKELINECKELL